MNRKAFADLVKAGRLFRSERRQFWYPKRLRTIAETQVDEAVYEQARAQLLAAANHYVSGAEAPHA